MKEFILAKVNEEKNFIKFIKLVFPTRRDAEMYLKGMLGSSSEVKWDIVEVERL